MWKNQLHMQLNHSRLLDAPDPDKNARKWNKLDRRCRGLEDRLRSHSGDALREVAGLLATEPRSPDAPSGLGGLTAGELMGLLDTLRPEQRSSLLSGMDPASLSSIVESADDAEYGRLLRYVDVRALPEVAASNGRYPATGGAIGLLQKIGGEQKNVTDESVEAPEDVVSVRIAELIAEAGHMRDILSAKLADRHGLSRRVRIDADPSPAVQTAVSNGFAHNGVHRHTNDFQTVPFSLAAKDRGSPHTNGSDRLATRLEAL